MMALKLEALHLRDRKYAVHPVGTVGTCGWIDGKPWQVVFVTASSAADAVRKATRKLTQSRGE